MSTPHNAPFAVSILTYPLPAWRYWALFQSAAQLQSFMLMVAVCTLVIHMLAVTSGARVMPPWYLAALLAVGALAPVVMAMRARFTVTPASEAAVRRLVTEVEVARLVEDGVVGNAVRYRQNLPRILRWDEASISIARKGDALIVTGPVHKLRAIRRQLIARS